MQIEYQKIKKLIEESLRYSSGDNGQPFLFQIIGSDGFNIIHSSLRSKHRMNTSLMASRLALGTLLESLDIVAQNFQIGLKLEYTEEINKTDGIWVKVYFRDYERLDQIDPLFYNMISKRVTHRGDYLTDKIDQKIYKKIKSISLERTQATLKFYDELPHEVERLMLKIEGEAWKDPELAKSVFKAIRFSKKSVLKTKDGMPWPSLKLSFFIKPMMMMIKFIPLMYPFVVLTGGTFINKMILKKQLKNTGGFGFYFVKSSDFEELVSVGRAMFRVWLYATSENLAFQPLSLATLPVYQSYFKLLPRDWSPKLQKYYKDLNSVMGETDILTWGFRMGYPKTKFTSEEFSLRRPIEDVLKN